MSLEDTTPTVSDRYTVIPVSKETNPYNKTAENNSRIVVMDIKILHKNGVKTLRPVHKPYHEPYMASSAGHDEENPDPQPEKLFSLQRFSWFQWLVDFYAVPRFRKRINEAVFIIIIGIIAGTLAVLTEANLNNRTSDTILINRLDRLIRAVELDWGR